MKVPAFPFARVIAIGALAVSARIDDADRDGFQPALDDIGHHPVLHAQVAKS
jgi:hypothetical protein